MDIDDKRDVNGEFLARPLTLVRGEAREVAPYQSPKLELVVNAERKLFEAVMANDPRRVSTWLARGADANARDRDGRTPLFEAVLWWKNPAIAELLIGRGADVRARDKDGQTPLYAAAAFGDEAHLCVVLDHGAEIDARDAHGRTPLHYAAHLGRGEATTYLVSRGADISLRDHDGRTPLDLLRTTIRLDPQQEYRWAPLERMLGGVVTMKVTEAGPQRGVADWGMLEALQDNDPKRVATWLARGADANFRSEGGRTPLFEAALPWKNPAIAELLLAQGADVRARDENGQTPLHVAAFYGGEARVVLFLNHGAEIDARDATGRTPLHCAASLGRIEEATSLVSRGADVSLLDHEGRTPLDLVRDMDLLREDYREPLERLLAGFITVKIVEARPDSLILRVESLHVRFSDAERVATERGTLTIPAALLRDVPEVGELIQCRKGLSPVLDEAWSEARRRDLGIEPVR